MPIPAMRKRTRTPLTEGICTVARWATAYAASEERTMTAPPIVGVPRLVWCEVGPSSRMNWP